MRFLTRKLPLLLMLLLWNQTVLTAGEYYVLCEGNFGQANASLWSFDDSFTNVQGPLLWTTDSNPLGDVGQSLTLDGHILYIVMNNSHVIRMVNLQNGPEYIGDIELSGASPRYMAVQPDANRAFVSSWTLGGLLIVDLNTLTVSDTLLLGALPEELLIENNRLFVSMPMHTDWSADNEILELDIQASPEIAARYTVIPGPSSMVLSEENLYVTSVYYNDAWESFTGTSRINLNDGTVLTTDQGAFANYGADVDLINGTPYRIYANSIMGLNPDLSFNTSSALANESNIYSFSMQNNRLILGISNFEAPDTVRTYSATGQLLGTVTLGALPGDAVYYDPDVVAVASPVPQVADCRLWSNYPNPFNPETSIRFDLAETAQVSLKIYDIAGREVVTLIQKTLAAGQHAQYWDGNNSTGTAMPSGTYWAVLASGETRQMIRMSLLR